MNPERTALELADLQRVLKVREDNLEKAQRAILETTKRLENLNKEATVWEQGIASAEGAIEELMAQLDESPLDMTPTGEHDTSGPETDMDWEAHGFTLSED